MIENNAKRTICPRCLGGAGPESQCRCVMGMAAKMPSKVNGMYYPGSWGFRFPQPERQAAGRPKEGLRDYDFIVNGSIFLD